MAKFKIKPLDDRVVVEQSKAEEVTAGGIFLPETAKEKPHRGKVVAIGSGKMLDTGHRAPMTVKIGDEVIYGKYSGNEVEVGGTKYYVLRETDVLAVVD